MIDEPVDALIEPPGSESALAPLPLLVNDDLDSSGIPGQGTSWREIVDNRVLLLSTLFFVTAALGIPLLWQSRAFSRPAKWVLTMVILAYTGLLFWVFWLIMVWCYHRIAASFV
jgi:hypothetical protein